MTAIKLTQEQIDEVCKEAEKKRRVKYSRLERRLTAKVEAAEAKAADWKLRYLEMRKRCLEIMEKHKEKP